MNDDDSILDLYPISDEIISSTEKMKKEYYQDQIKSDNLFPFISFDSSFPHFSSYPYGSESKLHSQIDVYNLPSYIHSYIQQYSFFLFSMPCFDRPSIDFTPTRDEYLFVPPQLTSESFIYSPIEKPIVDDSLRKFSLAWESPLSKEDCDEVRLGLDCE